MRHGRSKWNEVDRCQGANLTPPLNVTGRSQSLVVAQQIVSRGRLISALYSSDQRRALETAEIVVDALGGIPVRPDPRLREMDQGVWEGMLYDDIKREYGAEYQALYDTPFEMIPPGGQSMASLAEQMFAALDDIAAAHPDEVVLVISHEFPLALALCAAQGISLLDMFQHTLKNCEMVTVQWPPTHPINIPQPSGSLSAGAYGD
jgi:broad specificity phosphatase PhoE